KEISYVTGAVPPLRTVISRVTGPPSLSPSDSLPGETVVVDRIASSTSSRPAPWWLVGSRMPRLGLSDHTAGSAVFWNASRTCSGSASGWACRYSAAAPATCGEAIDVPEFDPYAPPSSGSVDQIEPPGAPRSGFSDRSAARPNELKSDTRPPVGFGACAVSSVQVTSAPSSSVAVA